MAKEKNPHAVALGRLGGKASIKSRDPEAKAAFHKAGGEAGGAARAEKLSGKRKREIASAAAKARWAKVNAAKKKAAK